MVACRAATFTIVNAFVASVKHFVFYAITLYPVVKTRPAALSTGDRAPSPRRDRDAVGPFSEECRNSPNQVAKAKQTRVRCAAVCRRRSSARNGLFCLPGRVHGIAEQSVPSARLVLREDRRSLAGMGATRTREESASTNPRTGAAWMPRARPIR